MAMMGVEEGGKKDEKGGLPDSFGVMCVCVFPCFSCNYTVTLDSKDSKVQY